MDEEDDYWSDEAQIYIKVKYENENRRVLVYPYYISRQKSLEQLQTAIFETFKMNGDAQQLEIRFRDKDGDVITMSSDDDVKYALMMDVSEHRMEVSWTIAFATSFKKFLGPCGGAGGTRWNDGRFEGIKSITVTADSTTLYSIQVTYATADGNTHIAARHGGDSGKEIYTVFKYPSEKLVKISGHCGTVYDNTTVIKGLTFETNYAKYGPFGVLEDWIPFELDLTSAQVAGFHGRASGKYLDSLALHQPGT